MENAPSSAVERSTTNVAARGTAGLGRGGAGAAWGEGVGGVKEISGEWDEKVRCGMEPGLKITVLTHAPGVLEAGGPQWQ